MLLDNLQLQVWALAASALGAQCAHHTEVEGWIAELGGCDVQGAVLGTCIQSDCVPSIQFFAVTVTHDYQGNKTSPSVLFVPP